MKFKHRFTYAGTVRGVGRRVAARPAAEPRHMPADWKRLHVSETAAHGGHGLTLSAPLRIAVAGALVVVCLAVLSKEPFMHAQLASWLAQAGNAWDVWRAGAKPGPIAAPARLPEEITSKPVLVETAPAAFKPVALVSDGGVFALGEHGEVKTCGPECTAERFPVLTGLAVREVPGTMGVMLQTDADMSVVHAVLRASWADQFSEINLAKLPELVIYSRDGVKILLNADAQLDLTLRRLALVLKDLRARNVRALAVDARYKDQIVMKPRRADSRAAEARGPAPRGKQAIKLEARQRQAPGAMAGAPAVSSSRR